MGVDFREIIIVTNIVVVWGDEFDEGLPIAPSFMGGGTPDVEGTGALFATDMGTIVKPQDSFIWTGIRLPWLSVTFLGFLGRGAI